MRAFALLVVLLLLPFMAMAEEKAPMFDPDSPLAGAPEILISEGKKFRVPSGYIHQRTRNYGTKHGIDLWMLWPGLVPQHDGNTIAFHTPGGGAKLDTRVKFYSSQEASVSFLWKMAHPEYFRESPDKWLPQDFSQRQWGESIYGLEAGYIDINKVIRWLSLSRMENIDELDEFEKGRWDDLFYQEDKTGHMKTVIHCTTRELGDPPEEMIDGKNIVRVPYCNHIMIIPELSAYITIDYRRVFLKDWNEIEYGVRLLLLKFSNDAK